MLTNREKYAACRELYPDSNPRADKLIRILLDLPATDPSPPVNVQPGAFFFCAAAPVLLVKRVYLDERPPGAGVWCVEGVDAGGQTLHVAVAALTPIHAFNGEPF